MWHATPGTLGSSNALTQTLSLAPMKRKVVLTQAMSSARAALPHEPPGGARKTLPGRTNHRLDAAGRVARHAAPVHRGAGPRRGARAGHGRGRGHRGDARRRPGRLVVQLRVLPGGRDPADPARPSTRPSGPRSRCCCCPAWAPCATSARRTTRARRWPGSPPTAPRPTWPRSTSARPANWAWRRSASSCWRTGSARPNWPRKPGSWSIPAPSACTWWTPPGPWCWPTRSRGYWR